MGLIKINNLFKFFFKKKIKFFMSVSNKIQYTVERNAFFLPNTTHLLILPLNIYDYKNFYLQYQTTTNNYIESDYGIAINNTTLDIVDIIKILYTIYEENNTINQSYWNNNFDIQKLHLFYLLYYIDSSKVDILTIKTTELNDLIVFNLMNLKNNKIYNINEKIYLTKTFIKNHLNDCDKFIDNLIYNPISNIKRKCLNNNQQDFKNWKIIKNINNTKYLTNDKVYVRKFKSEVEVNSWIALYGIKSYINNFNNNYLLKCTKIWLLMPYEYLQTTNNNDNFSEEYLLKNMRNKYYQSFSFILFGKPYHNFLQMDFSQVHDIFHKNMLLKDTNFLLYNDILLCAVWTPYTKNYIYGDFSVFKYKNLMIYSQKELKYTNVAKNICIKDTLEFKLPTNFIKYV